MKSMSWLALVVIAVATPPARGDGGPAEHDGVWLPTAATLGGQALPDEVLKSIKLELKGDAYTVTMGGRSDRGTCKWDAGSDPKAVDVVGSQGPNQGKTIPAIYEREGEVMRICYDLTGKARPREFKSPEGSQVFLVEYRRQSPRP